MNQSGLVVDCAFVTVPGYEILKGAYLRADSGRLTAIFGLNGSGKTTLLRVAAGHLTPDSGITVIDGRRFFRPERTARFEHIAYLPQTSMLPGGLRVRHVARIAGMEGSLAEDPLLAPAWSTRVEALSHGQRRYLELAIVLSTRRRYLLLDEPFTGIEPLIIDRIVDRLTAAVREGAGILLTDHYLQYSLPIAERAYLMQNKGCRDLGSGAEIDRNLRDAGFLRA